MKNNYLLILSISPVQSFISQARKTQDLFAGSAILSQLIETAKKKLKEHINDDDIIFPKSSSQNNASNPNRIVAIINEDQVDKLEELKNNINKNFVEIINTKDVSDEIVKTQIENFLNVNYVAVPLNDEPGENYQKAYKLAEQYLGAVKNAGEFKQLNERGKKCSLCGERNVVYVKDGMKKKFELKPNWKNLTDDEKQQCNFYNNNLTTIKGNKLKNTEGLCAVCAGKRFYDSKGIKSTAYYSLLEQIGVELLDEWEKQVGDSQLLYKENFNEQNYKPDNNSGLPFKCDDNKCENDCKKSASCLRNYIFKKKNLKASQLQKYYALLQFDGDSMGKWLSGINLKEKSNLKEFHKELSTCLSTFAGKATEIVDEFGKTVYAGGDDFLGFVNLAYLDKVIKELNDKFEREVNTKLNKKLENEVNKQPKYFIKDNKKLTFSTSIVIAHYKTPLDKVLKYGRNELKNVKSHYRKNGKNGTAITYITKSNTITTAYYQQKLVDDFNKLKILLTDPELCDGDDNNIFKTTKCSSRFFNVFAREFINFETESLTYDDYLKLMNMMKSELKRLLKRATDIKGKSEEEKIEKLNEIYTILENLLYAQVKEHRSNCYSFEFGNFINLCNIADKLSRGGDK